MFVNEESVTWEPVGRMGLWAQQDSGSRVYLDYPILTCGCSLPMTISPTIHNTSSTQPLRLLKRELRTATAHTHLKDI